jgi:hypothetical protein
MPRTYEPIASQTLGSNAASVTFSDIPGTYTDLRLVAFARSTRSATNDFLLLRFNSDSGSNYSRTYLYGNGTSALSTRNSNLTLATVDSFPAANSSSGIFCATVIDFMSYANTNVFKTVLSRNSDNSLTGATVNLWRSTSAITSILLYPENGPNLASGSTFSLFGLKAA